ncbi:MAG: alpha/beta hydrolase [Betaproteobacteria bacterium]|nr:alpha/beta hydrolase [Betaproteobacteria bacterium]
MRAILGLLAVPSLILAGPCAWGQATDFDPFDTPSAAHVNEGQLHFLSELPNKPVHHHRNEIVITDASLDDGWVQLRQCHEHLDPVPNSQVVFNRDRTRDLRIEQAEGIGRAWIEGHTVQLRDTGHAARLCVTAASRALARLPDGAFNLRNGPFLRRFLDGYFPMRVSQIVRVETARLRFRDATPAPQAGFRVWRQGMDVHYEAQFEGRLITILRFGPAGD